jgi:hypothetical protein
MREGLKIHFGLILLRTEIGGCEGKREGKGTTPPSHLLWSEIGGCEGKREGRNVYHKYIIFTFTISLSNHKYCFLLCFSL